MKNVAFALFLSLAVAGTRAQIADSTIQDQVLGTGSRYGITGAVYQTDPNIDKFELSFDVEYPATDPYYGGAAPVEEGTTAPEGGRNLRGATTTQEGRKMVQWVPKDAIKTVPLDELTRERNLQDEDGTADGGYSYGGSSGYVVAAYGVDDAAIGASLEVEIKYQSAPSYDDED